MAAPGGFFGRPNGGGHAIVIPEELVPLLRDGLYFDLHGQLEETSGLDRTSQPTDISAGVAGCLSRAEAARALLDVVGWIDPIEPPTAVEVDVRDTTTRCCERC